jgi:hypothetical protein
LAIGRDGRALATGASTRGPAVDIEMEQAISAPLPGLPNQPVVPLFAPDGTRLIAACETASCIVGVRRSVRHVQAGSRRGTTGGACTRRR